MQTIAISGANRGIGLELSRRYVARGDRVIAGARHPGEAAALHQLATVGELELQPLDVSDGDSVRAFADAVGTRPLDVLINNAGVFGGEHQAVDDMDWDAWLRTLQVNTLGPFRLAAALHANLTAGTQPRVVTVSSQMGSLQRESTGHLAYRSSKAAVNKVMQVLALEWAADRIVVCPVHPGWVRTDMGGAEADISVEESVAGLIALVDGLRIEHSGRFWCWNGEEHPW